MTAAAAARPSPILYTHARLPRSHYLTLASTVAAAVGPFPAYARSASRCVSVRPARARRALSTPRRSSARPIRFTGLSHWTLLLPCVSWTIAHRPLHPHCPHRTRLEPNPLTVRSPVCVFAPRGARALLVPCISFRRSLSHFPHSLPLFPSIYLSIYRHLYTPRTVLYSDIF